MGGTAAYASGVECADVLLLLLFPCFLVVLQAPEPTRIQTFHNEGFVPPPMPDASFSHK